jgi:hypothetical protein
MNYILGAFGFALLVVTTFAPERRFALKPRLAINLAGCVLLLIAAVAL